jgi:hypothetical protein
MIVDEVFFMTIMTRQQEFAAEDHTQDVIVFSFPVLEAGWECDPMAWIMQRSDGTVYLKMTSHGSPYIADVSELFEHLTMYSKVISQTKEAIRYLEKK